MIFLESALLFPFALLLSVTAFATTDGLVTKGSVGQLRCRSSR
jgi:hypothetical protein